MKRIFTNIHKYISVPSTVQILAWPLLKLRTIVCGWRPFDGCIVVWVRQTRSGLPGRGSQDTCLGDVPWTLALPHSNAVLSNLFHSMGHFKNFPVAEGRTARLLQSNPAKGTVSSPWSLLKTRPRQRHCKLPMGVSWTPGLRHCKLPIGLSSRPGPDNNAFCSIWHNTEKHYFWSKVWNHLLKFLKDWHYVISSNSHSHLNLCLIYVTHNSHIQSLTT